jgi:hypothetical protein
VRWSGPDACQLTAARCSPASTAQPDVAPAANIARVERIVKSLLLVLLSVAEAMTNAGIGLVAALQRFSWMCGAEALARALPVL